MQQVTKGVDDSISKLSHGVTGGTKGDIVGEGRVSDSPQLHPHPKPDLRKPRQVTRPDVNRSSPRSSMGLEEVSSRAPASSSPVVSRAICKPQQEEAEVSRPRKLALDKIGVKLPGLTG